MPIFRKPRNVGAVISKSPERYQYRNAYWAHEVRANVTLRETTDPALVAVEVEGAYIGCVRKEPDGWMPIGGFIFPAGLIPDRGFVPHMLVNYDLSSHEIDGMLGLRGTYNLYFAERARAVEVLVVAWIASLDRAIGRMLRARQRKASTPVIDLSTVTLEVAR
jgi:hypothetical protein